MSGEVSKKWLDLVHVCKVLKIRRPRFGALWVMVDGRGRWYMVMGSLVVVSQFSKLNSALNNLSDVFLMPSRTKN